MLTLGDREAQIKASTMVWRVEATAGHTEDRTIPYNCSGELLWYIQNLSDIIWRFARMNLDWGYPGPG